MRWIAALLLMVACSDKTSPTAKPEAAAKDGRSAVPSTTTPSTANDSTDAGQPGAPPTDDLAVMSGFRDRVCACADLACGQAVMAEAEAWMKRAPSTQPPPVVTDETQAKAKAIGVDMGMCIGALEREQRVPESLDRAAISSAVAAIKPNVAVCGDSTNAKGRVKLAVVVNPDGRVLRATVEATPDPKLGDCVAAAMQKATFIKTKNGGTFGYPFVF